jgi:hypothetical protein
MFPKASMIFLHVPPKVFHASLTFLKDSPTFDSAPLTYSKKPYLVLITNLRPFSLKTIKPKIPKLGLKLLRP